jgi:DNA polymerase-4
MWYYLRGYDLPDIETEKSTIGHSHVLPPELRPPAEAYHVAKRLMLKAVARLRRFEHCAERIVLSVRLEQGGRFAIEGRVLSSDDSFVFSNILDAMWHDLSADFKNQRIKKISITLLNLIPKKDRTQQGDLFLPLITDVQQQKINRNEKISAVMDSLNQKFGRDTVQLGLTPKQGRTFTGTKVAFTRIPDVEEFFE